MSLEEAINAVRAELDHLDEISDDLGVDQSEWVEIRREDLEALLEAAEEAL